MFMFITIVLMLDCCVNAQRFSNTYVYSDSLCQNLIGLSVSIDFNSESPLTACAAAFSGGRFIRTSVTSTLPTTTLPGVVFWSDAGCSTFGGASFALPSAGCVNSGVNFGVSFQISCSNGVITANKWNSVLDCSGTPSLPVLTNGQSACQIGPNNGNQWYITTLNCQAPTTSTTLTTRLSSGATSLSTASGSGGTGGTGGTTRPSTASMIGAAATTMFLILFLFIE